jgi:hypothetical protein
MDEACPQKSVSVSPGFSPVLEKLSAENRFNGFTAFVTETVKTVSKQCEGLSTGLKPGVNETNLRQSRWTTMHSY